MKTRLPAESARNAGAFIHSAQVLPLMLAAWWATLGPRLPRLLVIAQPGSPLLKAVLQMPGAVHSDVETPQAMGLNAKPFSIARFEAKLLERLEKDGMSAFGWAVLVDMDWALLSPSATANASVWSGSVQRLLEAGVRATLSVYHRRHTPERLLLTGLHAHAGVVSVDGCHPNPYQLPPEISGSTATRRRVDHWLARISESLRSPDTAEPSMASGASSNLLRDQAANDDDLEDERADAGTAPADRWKVRCFGQFRIYRNDGQRIEWKGGASASRKVRALFAFLLLRRSKGATAEELVELLWPDAVSEEAAMNRLHHSITFLRRLLAPDVSTRAREHPYLLRQDQHYVLRPPANTWIDVDDFEQLCRQGGTLLQEEALREALLCLESALNLYTGDLFADLPAAMTESRDPDWCWSRRYWFREMYFKVHRDCASIHRQLGNYLQAIPHCQSALERDPACEMAHGELMRIFAAQGRREAIERQYRVYRMAAAKSPAPSNGDAMTALYVELMRDTPSGKTRRN